jgi:coenzyme PQQ precursor peptide PqqA
MALAVLPKVAPFCADRCLLPVGVWKTPRIVEIAVGMEINTYACADL